MMNEFLIKKMSSALKGITSQKYKNEIIKEFWLLDKIGIENELSLRKFHYISQMIPRFSESLVGGHDSELITKAASFMVNRIDDINSYEDMMKIFSDYIVGSRIVKTAYPNLADTIIPIKNYDMPKWKSALNDIMIRSRVYGDFNKAMEYVTRGWNDMDEKHDFDKWVEYNKNGIGKLYKSAFSGGMSVQMPYIPGLTPDTREDVVQNGSPSYDPDDIRRRILSRISSIEKILISRDGRKFVGSDYNQVLKNLLELKGDVFRVKSASMINDLICRAANSLEHAGGSKFSKTIIMKIAQGMGEMDMSGMSGMGADPMGMPGAEGGPEQSTEKGTPDDGKKAIDNFILNMTGYEDKKLTPEEIRKTKDKILKDFENKVKKASTTKFAWYDLDTSEFMKFKKVANNIGGLLEKARYHRIVTAQEVDISPSMTTEPTAIKDAPPMKSDIMEEPVDEMMVDPMEGNDIPPVEMDLKKEIKEKPVDNLDGTMKSVDIIDEAFKNIKISDVILRMDALSRVFKNREIAKQLSIIDLMLDSLGLSGFFPALAEATRSALESNQYCQTRIEEVLSKLTSATDESGDSVINIEVLEPKKKSAPSNLIDEEMDRYLNKEKPEAISAEPRPISDTVVEKAVPQPIKPMRQPPPQPRPMPMV